jgi:hypothetical protein
VALATDAAQRDKMGEAARQRIEERFEAARMVEATACVYANL